jgi:hypothetical protein
MKLSLSPVSLVSLSMFTLTLGLLAAGCSAPRPERSEPVADAENGLRTTYGDLRTTLDAADLGRWEAVRASLVSGFDRICGETSCSGDYANLTTVRLACSSTMIARKMKDCVWTLGASVADVDRATGALTSRARTFECHVPVAGSAHGLLEALEAARGDALHAPLPGTGASFYDALVACFAGVHAPPPPGGDAGDAGAPASGKPAAQPAGATGQPIAFLELTDLLADQDETTRTGWVESKRHLAQSFDDACGDTFCEGDYPDIAALGLACAVDRAAAKVTHCDWSFAAADVTVGPRGRLDAHAETKHCDVAIDASPAAFLAAVAGADPLRAPLPGKPTSIYDALVGCL